MTFKRIQGIGLVICSLLMLTACPGTDDNSFEGGIVLHVAEVHSQERPGNPVVDIATVQNSEDVQGGYDQASIEHHPIRDINGRILSLYRAYVTLDNIQLVKCPGLAQLPERLMDVFVGRVYAHAGHGTEPVGGRALDRPNVIDIVTQEDFVLPLGDTAVAPGRYCSARVAMVRLAGEAYGQPEFSAASNDDPTSVPEVPDLSGRMFSIRSDYCAETDAFNECIRRVKVDVDDDTLNEPFTQEIEFDQPLELNSQFSEGSLVIGVAYGEWVQNVDITRLASDRDELQKLLDNISSSIHVNFSGLGGLP